MWDLRAVGLEVKAAAAVCVGGWEEVGVEFGRTLWNTNKGTLLICVT